jgi:hypothetical protein
MRFLITMRFGRISRTRQRLAAGLVEDMITSATSRIDAPVVMGSGVGWVLGDRRPSHSNLCWVDSNGLAAMLRFVETYSLGIPHTLPPSCSLEVPVL